MSEREFLCGPKGAVSRDDLTLQDRAALDDFARFLGGDTAACPVCLQPLEDCTSAKPCCPDCPGWHLIGGTKPPTRREVPQ